jgi:hypothetical protein
VNRLIGGRGGLNAERNCEWPCEGLRPRRFAYGDAAGRCDETKRIDRRHRREKRYGGIGVPGRHEAGSRLCAVVAQTVHRRQLVRGATVLVARRMVGRRMVVRDVILCAVRHRGLHSLRFTRDLTDLQRDGCAHDSERDEQREESLHHRIEYTACSNANGLDVPEPQRDASDRL